MSQARDDVVPHFSSMEERDRWQIQQYGHVRNGFRTDLERADERPLLILTRPDWEYLPAVRARFAAAREGKDRWTCPGCSYSYRTETPGCDACNAAEEQRYLKAVRLCPPSQWGRLDLFVYLSEIAKIANGSAPSVRAMPEVVAEGEA